MSGSGRPANKIVLHNNNNLWVGGFGIEGNILLIIQQGIIHFIQETQQIIWNQKNEFKSVGDSEITGKIYCIRLWLCYFVPSIISR